MTYFQKLRSVTSTSFYRSKSQVQGEGITQGHEHQQEWFIEGKGGIWRLDTILINSYISFCSYVFGSLIWIVNSLRTRILPYIFYSSRCFTQCLAHSNCPVNLLLTKDSRDAKSLDWQELEEKMNSLISWTRILGWARSEFFSERGRFPTWS